MDRTQILLAVLASGGLGALISSVIQELGRWRERRSRREELALAKAAELSRLMYEGGLEMMKMHHNATVTVRPQTEMVRDSYRMFKHLLDHGELDPRSHEELEEELAQYAAKKSGNQPGTR